MPSPAVTDSELDELLALAPAGSVIALRFESERDGRGTVRPEEAAVRAHRAVPRLIDEVRRLRRELGTVREEAQRAEAKRSTGAPPAEPAPAADELASLLAAPFRVSANATSKAKDDPLVALAVQVARALGEDASELDRARLLAMAFAASEGDLEAFWEARRRRSAGPKAAARKK